MKKTVIAVMVTVGLIFTGTAQAEAATPRHKFSSSVVKKLKTAKHQKVIDARVKKYKTPRAFEFDIRGCEIAYKVRTKKQSDCLNQTIVAHKQYK